MIYINYSGWIFKTGESFTLLNIKQNPEISEKSYQDLIKIFKDRYQKKFSEYLNGTFENIFNPTSKVTCSLKTKNILSYLKVFFKYLWKIFTDFYLQKTGKIFIKYLQDFSKISETIFLVLWRSSNIFYRFCR